jgi:hypothetical protein
MMARNATVPLKGRIQNRKTHDLQIITFGLQRAAGPYRRARNESRTNKNTTNIEARKGPTVFYRLSKKT